MSWKQLAILFIETQQKFLLQLVALRNFGNSVWIFKAETSRKSQCEDWTELIFSMMNK